MFFTDGNSSGGAGTGTGAAAAQGANTAGANGQAGGNDGGGKAGTEEYVSKSELTALTKKLDSVLADNAKYRAKIKALASDDDSDDTGTGGGKPDKNAEKLVKALAAARVDRFTSQVTTAAVKLGAEHPELVVRALDIDEVADDLGSVKDVDKVVGDLKTKYPNLFAKAQNNGFGDVNGGTSGGNNRKRTSADVNAEIRAFRRGRELPAR